MHLVLPTFVIILIIIPQEITGRIRNQDVANPTVSANFLDKILKNTNKVQTPSNYSYCKFDIRNEKDHGISKRRHRRALKPSRSTI